MSNDIEALPKLSESILDDELDKKDSKGDESDDRVEAGNPKHAGEGLEDRREHLNRALSARQVQMIAIAGTIGTGRSFKSKTMYGVDPDSMMHCVYQVCSLVPERVLPKEDRHHS